jgi:hypothetical protein
MVAPDPGFRGDRSPAQTPRRSILARAARLGHPAPPLAVTLLIIGLCTPLIVVLYPFVGATLALLCALLSGISVGL